MELSGENGEIKSSKSMLIITKYSNLLNGGDVIFFQLDELLMSLRFRFFKLHTTYTLNFFVRSLPGI